MQEYRARKRQKLQKKLAEQLRTSSKGGQGGAGLGLGADLMSVLNSFVEQSSSHHTKGSRFQHAEKLQFAKVRASSEIALNLIPSLGGRRLFNK